MSEQPTICAVCGGAFEPGQAIEWPEGLSADWAAHARFSDCARVALSPIERRQAAKYFAVGAPLFGAWVAQFAKATKRPLNQPLFASLTRAAREELHDWTDYSQEA